jgi:hypothetical protein
MAERLPAKCKPLIQQSNRKIAFLVKLNTINDFYHFLSVLYFAYDQPKITIGSKKKGYPGGQPFS